jgi:hypothetical protein
MRARLSTATLLALTMSIGACVEVPLPVPVGKKIVGRPAADGPADLRESEDLANRLFEAQLERGRVIEMSATGAPASTVGHYP